MKFHVHEKKNSVTNLKQLILTNFRIYCIRNDLCKLSIKKILSRIKHLFCIYLRVFVSCVGKLFLLEIFVYNLEKINGCYWCQKKYFFGASKINWIFIEFGMIFGMDIWSKLLCGRKGVLYGMMWFYCVIQTSKNAETSALMCAKSWNQ